MATTKPKDPEDLRMRPSSLSIVAALVIVCAATFAGAQTQQPELGGGPPSSSLIGEGFCFTSTFTNPGGDPGYGPYLRLTVPPGVSFDSASVYNTDLVSAGLVIDVGVFGPPPAGGPYELTDPITDTTVTGEEGAHFYILKAPIGSVIFGQPVINFEICMTIGLPPDAEVGVPENIVIQPVYEFGDTPTGDNGAIEAPPVTFPVTPTLIVFDKDATDGKNAAGPSDPAGFVLSADIANQQTMTDLVFTDTLPASFVYTGHTISGGVGCFAITQPPVGGTGGTLVVECTEATGAIGGGDITVTISGYADDILDHDSCDVQDVINSATLTADYLGVPQPPLQDTAFFTTRHAVVDKSGSSTGVPGGTAGYTIALRVSDYVDITNMVLVDVLPDGLDFDLATANVTLIFAGNPYPITPVVQQDTPGIGRTTVTYDISAALFAGSPSLTQLDGGSAGSLSYTAGIQRTYDASGAPVLANDSLANTITAAFDIVGAASPACSDGSTATATIVPVSIIKDIVNPQTTYRPGDVVIFSLTMTIPSGDASQIVLVDFLPLPVFDADTVDPTWTTGDVYSGPATTPDVTAILAATPPTVEIDSPENSIRLDFPDVSTEGPQVLQVYLEATITSDAFADGLWATNIFQASTENSQQLTSSGLKTLPIVIRAPELEITKGVLTTTNPNSTIDPAPPADPLDAAADGDLEDADAGDTVTWTITVENLGGAPAGNVRLWDLVPAGVAGCGLDSVRLGDGTALAAGTGYTGDVFDPANPLTLANDLVTGAPDSGALDANDEDPSTFGRDTAVVELSCGLALGVEPRGVLVNTASAVWTTRLGEPGTGDFPQIDDDATATISDPVVTKNAAPLAGAIGELVAYQIEVTVPEGTSSATVLVDAMPSGLAFADCVSVSASAGLATSIGSFADACNDPVNPAVGPGGQTVTFDFGTVTNTDTDDTQPERITVVLSAVVLNVGSNNNGASLTNTATWTWAGGSMADGASVGVLEPLLRVVKDTVPSPLPAVDAGDTVSFTITVDHLGPSTAPAFDVVFSDVIPAGLTYVPGTLDCTLGTLVPDICAEAGNAVTASWVQIPVGTFTVMAFDVTTDISVNPGTTIQNVADLVWTSLPGDPGLVSPYNPNSCERTQPPGACGAGNDYSSTDVADVVIASVGVAKRVTATSEPSTGSSEHTPGIDDLAIGETATFEIVATLPEGTVPQVVITDTLPYAAGVMELVSARLVRIGDGPGLNLTVTNDPPIITSDDLQLGDTIVETVSFDFGPVVNTPDGVVSTADEIVVEVIGRLKNVAANADGDLLTNSALIQFGPGLNQSGTALVEVVEPLLDVVKSGDQTQGDAGDTVVFTVTVEHDPLPRPSSTADAFDLVITDAVPTGMTYVPGSLTDTGAVLADSLTEAGGTITVIWDDFPRGSIGQFRFAATIDQSVIPGSTITNTASAVWDSLPANDDPEERDFGTSDGHSVLITSPGMSKVVFDTSEPSTGTDINGPEPDLTIGERVTYRFVATFIEGTTPAATMTDQLPNTVAVLSAVSSQVIRVGAGLSGSGLPAIGDSGAVSDNNGDSYPDQIVWTMGDIVNPPDGVTNPDDEIEFEVVAVVVDEPANRGGLNNVVNTATLSYTDGSSSGQALVDLVEPELRLTKTVADPADGFVDAGDTVTMEILIEHFGSTADAFSLEMVDQLPNPGLSWIGDGTVSTTCPGGVAVDSTGDPTIVFTLGDLPLGATSCTVGYQASVDLDVNPGVTYTNLAGLSWDSQPVFVAGETRRQTDTDTANLFLLAPAMVKIADSTSMADTDTIYHNPADFDLAIGESVIYRLTVIFPEGITNNAVVTDILPADAADGIIQAVGASVLGLGANLSTSLAGTPQFLDTPPNDGRFDTVVFDFGSVTNVPDGVGSDADRIVLQVVGQVVNETANADGDSLTNLGRLTFATGGPLEDTADVDVVEPSMAVAKSMGPVVNGLIPVTIQLTNSGTAPAYDVVLEDVFNNSVWNTATISPTLVPTGYVFNTVAGPGPDETTVVFASDPGSFPPDSSVEPGETVTFMMEVQLADPANPPPQVVNTATNTGATSLPNTDPEDRDQPDVDQTAVLGLPFLDAIKSVGFAPGGDADGSGTVSPGDTLRYTIVVNNTGGEVATDVRVNDSPDTTAVLVVGSVAADPGGVVVTGNTAGDTTVEVVFAAVAANTSAGLTYDVFVPPVLPPGIDALVNQAVIGSVELPDFPSDDPLTGTDDDPTVVPLDASPDLAVSKTDGVTVAQPGDTLSYVITVENLGNQTATGVVVTDTLPSGTTFVSATDGGTETPPGSGTVVWPVFDLAPNASVVRTVTVTVDNPPLPSQLTLLNTVVAVDDGSNGPDSNPNNNIGTDNDQLIHSDLAVTKTDDPDPVNAGATLIWTLAMTNNGPSDATGVVLDDLLPPEVTLVTASPPCEGGFPCAVGDLAVGSTVVVTIEVLVATNAAGPIVNTATVTGDQADGVPDNNSATEATQIDRSADLSITKNGPGTVNRGDQLTFSFVVRNDGPSDATGVSVTDPTPESLTFVSATTPCAGGFPCALGGLAAGDELSFDATYLVPPGYVGPDPIVNTASVGSEVPDPDPGDNTSSSSTAVDRPPESDVAVDKTGPPSAAPGSTVSYDITVTNLGPDDAFNVILDDPTPVGLTFVSATAPCVGGFPCDLGTVNAGALVGLTVVFAIPVDYTSPDPILNTASVTTDSLDLDPTNDTATESTPLGIDTADVGVVKIGPVTATPGDDVAYELVVTNHGPATATGVALADPTPPGLIFVLATPPCAAGFPCALPDLSPGAQVRVTVTFNIPVAYSGSNPIVNTAVVTANEPDGDPENNSSLATTGLGGEASDLGLVKTGPTVAIPGRDLDYQITVTNHGPGTAASVVLDDAAPAGLTFVSATPPCAAGFPCAIGDLANGSSLTVGVTFSVPSGYTAPDPILNTATVTTDSPDSNPDNNSDDHVTPLALWSDLVVNKDDGVTSAVPGGSVVYTITVANSGPSDVAGATVTDVFPPEIVSATWTCAPTGGGSCTPGPMVGDINDIVDIPSGEAVVYTVVALIDAAATGVLVNVATVTPPPVVTDPDPGNNTDDDVNVLTGDTDLAVTKTDEPDPVTAGEVITWTLTVTNNGPSDATGVVLDDVLPPEVSLVSASPPCAAGFPCAIGNLASGTTVVVTVQAQVADDVIEPIVNTATVTGDQPDSIPDNNSDTEITDVIYVLLDVEKTVSQPLAGRYGPLDVVTWTVTVTNFGTAVAIDLLLTDPIPDHTTYVGESITLDGVSLTDAPDGDPGTFDLMRDEFEVVIATLGPGVTATVTFDTRLESVPGSATWTVENQATVDGPYGPVVSDDPMTPDVDDPTIILISSVAIPGLTPVGMVLLIALMAMLGIHTVRRMQMA